MSPTNSLIRINDENLARFEQAGRVLCRGLAEVRRFYDGGMVADAAAMPLTISHEQMADFVYARVIALKGWLDEIAQVVNTQLPQALQGSGREESIMRFCERMIRLGRELVSWEHDVARHQVPAHWHRIMSLLRGLTRPLARDLFRQVDGITSLPARLRAGEADIDLSMKMPNLPQLALLSEELPRACRAGVPFPERHPIMTALFLRTLLAH